MLAAGCRLIVFVEYTFGRFSSGIFVATASFPTSVPSCVGNGGSKLWGKPSAPGNQVTIENGSVVVHWQINTRVDQQRTWQQAFPEW